MTKMSMEEYTFIDLVEKFPQLWDKQEPLSKDTLANENAWKTISDMMNFTVEEAMALWKSLRLKYVRERKIRKSIPPGSTTSKSSWPLYEKLGFLDRTIRSRRTKRRWSNSNSGLSQMWQNTVIGEHRLHTPEHKEQDETDCEDVSEDRTNSPQEIERKESVVDPLSFHITSEAKRLRREDIPHKRPLDVSVENLVATISNLNDSLNSLKPIVGAGTLNKEDYYFGLSLAEYLANIKDPKKKLTVKSKILMMIADAID